MTDITTSPAAVNGNGTASQQKFRLLDAVHNDRRLSRADVCVAYFIINLFNPDKGYAWPSQETLAELTGLNLRTVKRAVGRLVRFGIVTITFRGRPGRSNEYVPVFVKGVRADTPLRTKGDSADTLMVATLVRKGDSADTPPTTTPEHSVGVVVDPRRRGGARA